MTDSTKGWVLYDDGCGFCREWVPFWAPTLRKRGFGIAPLQSTWAREALGSDGQELVSDIRLLFPDGRQIRGADVYRYMMAQIAWAYPLYVFSVAPGFRQVFDWSYRVFNRNRHRFSRACGLPNSAPDPEHHAV